MRNTVKTIAAFLFVIGVVFCSSECYAQHGESFNQDNADSAVMYDADVIMNWFRDNDLVGPPPGVRGLGGPSGGGGILPSDNAGRDSDTWNHTEEYFEQAIQDAIDKSWAWIDYEYLYSNQDRDVLGFTFGEWEVESRGLDGGYTIYVKSLNIYWLPRQK